MSANPRFLVVDGYLKSSRDELVAGGASLACDLYAAMLRRFAPGAEVDYRSEERRVGKECRSRRSP